VSITDAAPKNRREFAILAAGIALSLGLSAVPGLTVEPQALTDCRVASALCASERDAAIQERKDAAADYDARLERCRNAGHVPHMEETDAPE